MIAFREFENAPTEFWAFVRFVSETLGYSERGASVVKEYSHGEIDGICRQYNVNASDNLIRDTIEYSRMRADMLNNFVENMLMDARRVYGMGAASPSP